MNVRVLACAALGIAMAHLTNVHAEQPPPACHPNPNAAADRDAVASRGAGCRLPVAWRKRFTPHSDHWGSFRESSRVAATRTLTRSLTI